MFVSRSLRSSRSRLKSEAVRYSCFQPERSGFSGVFARHVPEGFAPEFTGSGVRPREPRGASEKRVYALPAEAIQHYLDRPRVNPGDSGLHGDVLAHPHDLALYSDGDYFCALATDIEAAQGETQKYPLSAS
jgi:hypothetical protein